MKKIYFMLSILLFIACETKKTQPTGTITNTQAIETTEEDPFIQLNAHALSLENEEIDLYIQHHEWTMIKTGTGLRYMLLREGDGAKPIEGNSVTLRFKTFLLTGEEIDNSEKSGDIHFVVNKSEAIPALHEAVQLMPYGSKARLIIPSHLAYGVSGDGQKIGIAQCLRMEIELLSPANIP